MQEPFEIFFSGATETEIDKQGRSVVSQNLIEYGSIVKDIVATGISNRI